MRYLEEKAVTRRVIKLSSVVLCANDLLNNQLESYNDKDDIN